MKKILLNKRQPERGLFAIVDDTYFDMLSKFNWTQLVGHTGIKYAVYKKGKEPYVYMHRFILKAPKGTIIDHINHNGLDNRKDNLRFCTYAENAINTGLWRHNTSGYKGVYWDKSRGKWAAQISNGKNHVYLGRFDKIENAIEARTTYEKSKYKHLYE